MAKSLFEEMGSRYERQGDYLIPCLTLPAEEEQPIGVWGERHLRYLKEYRRGTYINLLTSGRLNAYLAEIDKQAQERFERLVKGMKQTQGITERLKAENQLEWVQKLNNIRACAMEIVEKEIIYNVCYLLTVSANFFISLSFISGSVNPSLKPSIFFKE